MAVDDLEFDRSWFDREQESGTFRIKREMILDYAKAIEDQEVLNAAAGKSRSPRRRFSAAS